MLPSSSVRLFLFALLLFFYSWSSAQDKVSHYFGADPDPCALDETRALAYDDLNCPEAGQDDETVITLLSVIGDYLEIGIGMVYQGSFPEIKPKMNEISFNAYPNPLPAGSKININMHLKDGSETQLSVYNIRVNKLQLSSPFQEHRDKEIMQPVCVICPQRNVFSHF